MAMSGKRTKILQWFIISAVLLLFPASLLSDYIQKRNASLAPGPTDVQNCSAHQSHSDMSKTILSGSLINHINKSVVAVLIGFVPFDREGKFMGSVTYVPTNLHVPPRGIRTFVMSETMVFYPERLGGRFPTSVTCFSKRVTFADGSNWVRPALPAAP